MSSFLFFYQQSFYPLFVTFLHLLSFSSSSSSEILFNIFVIFSFASLLCHLFFSLLPIVLHILFQICIIYRPLLNICLLILQFHIYSFSMTNKLDLFHTNNLVYSLFSNKIFDVLYCIVCVRSAICSRRYRRDSSSRACFAIGRCFLLIIR